MINGLYNGLYSYIKSSTTRRSIYSAENSHILGCGNIARGLSIGSLLAQSLYIVNFDVPAYSHLSAKYVDRYQITFSADGLHLKMIFSLGKVYSVMGSVEAIMVFCWPLEISTLSFSSSHLLFSICLTFSLEIFFLWYARTGYCYFH